MNKVEKLKAINVLAQRIDQCDRPDCHMSKKLVCDWCIARLRKILRLSA